MVRKLGWLVALVLLVLSTQVVAAQITAEREISKTTVQQGETFTVSVTITATEEVYAPLLDEDLPEGWVVTQVDDAGFTFKPSEVKWLLMGSLSAGESRTIIYNVTVPEDAEEGKYYITGNISAYGVEPIPVSGDSEVTVKTGNPEFKLYMVEVPEYSWQYQTVSVTGYVKNEGTAEGDYIVALLVDGNPTDTQTGTLAPEKYDKFTLKYNFPESGTFSIEVRAAVYTTPPNVTDTEGPYTITIAPDEDKDCWNDTVEEIIQDYYTDFDPVNETPTKDDVVQAVINAVIEYIFTGDPQIKEDIKAMIKEYMQERPETCPV